MASLVSEEEAAWCLAYCYSEGQASPRSHGLAGASLGLAGSSVGTLPDAA